MCELERRIRKRGSANGSELADVSRGPEPALRSIAGRRARGEVLPEGRSVAQERALIHRKVESRGN